MNRNVIVWIFHQLFLVRHKSMLSFLSLNSLAANCDSRCTCGTKTHWVLYIILFNCTVIRLCRQVTPPDWGSRSRLDTWNEFLRGSCFLRMVCERLYTSNHTFAKKVQFQPHLVRTVAYQPPSLIIFKNIIQKFFHSSTWPVFLNDQLTVALSTFSSTWGAAPPE